MTIDNFLTPSVLDFHYGNVGWTEKIEALEAKNKIVLIEIQKETKRKPAKATEKIARKFGLFWPLTVDVIFLRKSTIIIHTMTGIYVLNVHWHLKKCFF